MFGVAFWFCVFLVLYVYAFYPGLVFLLANLRPGRKPYGPSFPAVTLLIAAYNEESVIASKLDNSLSLDYPPDKLQIVVAADGSNDRTVEIVNSYAGKGVQLSFNNLRQGKMSAINHGMEKAANEIVLFSDANNLYNSDTLREIVKPFADPGVGGVSGRKMIQKDPGALSGAEGTYWRYEAFIRKQESRLASCVGVSGEIFAIRRALFQALPSSTINDDFSIALQIMKQGYRIEFAPMACSLEQTSQAESDEITRRSRIVAGRYQAMNLSLDRLPFRWPVVIWEIVSHKYLRPLVPLAMVGAFLFNLLSLLPMAAPGRPAWLFLETPINLYFMAAQFAFYLLALLGLRFKFKGWTGRLLYLPAFLVNSNFAAVLGLARYLSGQQTVLWKKVTR